MLAKILPLTMIITSCNSNLALEKSGEGNAHSVSLVDSALVERRVARAGTSLTCFHPGDLSTAKKVSYTWSGTSAANDTSSYTVTQADSDSDISCSVSLVDDEGELFEGTSQSVKVSSLASAACPSESTENFASGLGTEADPYVICNASQFNLIRNGLGSYYELGADVDLSIYNGQASDVGTGFIPIGLDTANPSEPTPFTGSLVGNGFTIKNSTSDLKYSNGLFAKTDAATFSNIQFDSINHTATLDESLSSLPEDRPHAGIVTPMSSGSTYNDIKVTGSSVNGRFAGFIGQLTGGTHTFTNLDIAVNVGAEKGGALAGVAETAFDTDNVKVTTEMSTIGTGDQQSLGGLMGNVKPPASTSSTVNNTELAVTLTDSTDKSILGGAFGAVSEGGGDVSIDQLTVSGTISQSTASNGRVGGVVGIVSFIGGFDISKVSSSVNINSNAEYGGGLIGRAYRITASISLSQSNTSGTLSLSTDRNAEAGGLIGSVRSTKISVANSGSSANISLTSDKLKSVGGLIGKFSAEAGYTNASYQIDNVTTSGSLTIDRFTASDVSSSVGGLIGMIRQQKGGNSHIKNSVSSATITATRASQVGGLIGALQQADLSEEAVTVLIDSSSYQNSSSTALTVQHAKYVGGFIGEFDPSGILRVSGGSFKISNSHANAGIKFTVTIANTNLRAAGFIALKKGGAIEKSYAQGTIDFDTQTLSSGGWKVGGFVGEVLMDDADPLVKASIDDSYSTVGISVDNDVSDLNVGGVLGRVVISNNTNDLLVNNVYYYTNQFEIDGNNCTGGTATKNCNGLANGSYGGLVGGAGTINQDVKITGYDNLGFLGDQTDQNTEIIVYQGKEAVPTTNENDASYDGKPSGSDWSLLNLEGNNAGSWSSAIWKDNGAATPPTLK